MELISGERLGNREIKMLSELYVKMWEPVLKNEYSDFSHEKLVGEAVKQFNSRVSTFPEGQLSAWDPKDGIIGGMSTIMVSAYDELGNRDFSMVPEKWNELTSGGYIKNHDYNGNLLMCYAINVDPEHKGKGVARMILDGGKDFASERGITACPYTRPSGFRKYLEITLPEGRDSSELTREELDMQLNHYLMQRDSKGRHLDRNIGMHSHFGADIKRILPDSRPADKDSCGYCIIMAYPK